MKANLGVKINIPPMETVSTREDGDNLIVTVTANCPWQLTMGDSVRYGKAGDHVITVPNEGYTPIIAVVR